MATIKYWLAKIIVWSIVFLLIGNPLMFAGVFLAFWYKAGI